MFCFEHLFIYVELSYRVVNSFMSTIWIRPSNYSKMKHTLSDKCIQTKYTDYSATKLPILYKIEYWYNQNRVHSSLGYQATSNNQESD